MSKHTGNTTVRLPEYTTVDTMQYRGLLHERNVYFAALLRIASLPANAKAAEAKAIARKAMDETAEARKGN